MDYENIDQLMDRYALLLKIRFNNNDHDNLFLEDEIFNTKQRLQAQQVSTETLQALVYCTAHIQQNSLPNLSSDCVGFDQRCHRIASLSRLAAERLSGRSLLNMNGTVH